MDGGGFIRELCLALEYRWEPEKLFVLFTAHFDEADTHGAAPKIAMGALLGHGREWLLFRRRLNNIRRTEGFRIFHATKFKASKGEFEGWDDPKSMRLVNDLATLIQRTLTDGVLINLPYERYIDEYRQTPTPKGIDLDSQYGLCFRALMAHIVGIILEMGGKHKLHVVVERGHRNAKNTEKIFNEIKLTLKARGIELLGEWSLAAKEERDELMVADYLVHSYAMMIRPGGSGIRGYANGAPEPKKSDAGLTFLEFQPGSLKNIKSEMQRHRWERQAYNRRLKAEVRAGASSSSSEIEATAVEPPC
jgi:hypothetical protein